MARAARKEAAIAAAKSGQMSHRDILLVLIGLMSGMFLSALDQSVVGTAMRTIADDLQGLELQAISGCVLGGVSLTGGVARIQGVVVGVLIMGILQNAMSLQNIDAFWQLVTSGGVLLVAVLLDRWKNRA